MLSCLDNRVFSLQINAEFVYRGQLLLHDLQALLLQPQVLQLSRSSHLLGHVSYIIHMHVMFSVSCVEEIRKGRLTKKYLTLEMAEQEMAEQDSYRSRASQYTAVLGQYSTLPRAQYLHALHHSSRLSFKYRAYCLYI